MKVDFTPISKSLSSAKVHAFILFYFILFYFIFFFDSAKAHSFCCPDW